MNVCLYGLTIVHHTLHSNANLTQFRDTLRGLISTDLVWQVSKGVRYFVQTLLRRDGAMPGGMSSHICQGQREEFAQRDNDMLLLLTKLSISKSFLQVLETTMGKVTMEDLPVLCFVGRGCVVVPSWNISGVLEDCYHSRVATQKFCYTAMAVN